MAQAVSLMRPQPLTMTEHHLHLAGAMLTSARRPHHAYVI
jgi:hypothetical protein